MLIRGDARAIPLIDGCVDCVVTSPPYFGLRDYGASGQIGLEPSPDRYVASLVAVFRDVRRVLKDAGTCWVNLGSSYAGSGKGGNPSDSPWSGFMGSAAREKAAMPGGAGASDRIQSRQLPRAHAYGSDGTALRDSMAVDFAYSGLCDECLADFRSHRDRIAGSDRQTGRSERQPSLTDRDTAPSDCVSASLDASLLGAPASNTLESWRQHRGACSRCANRASCLSGLRSSSDDVLESVRTTTWVNYTSKLKHKDLIPTPWMVAMALQEDGWYLRSDIIWKKPNPMPESVTDRPTRAHEYLFLLAKSERYFYDASAIAEPVSVAMLQEMEQGYDGLGLKDYEAAGVQNPSSVKARIIERARVKVGAARDDGQQPHSFHLGKGYAANLSRNRRSVWTVPTMPYSGAHFATMPEKLVEPCILAGCPLGGLVLDSFVGSGTVVSVAQRLGRRGVGVDLSYHDLSKERTAQRGLIFGEATA